jgi:hypothetical protein
VESRPKKAVMFMIWIMECPKRADQAFWLKGKIQIIGGISWAKPLLK